MNQTLFLTFGGAFAIVLMGSALFLLRQTAVVGRVWSRLLFYSAQSAMYQELRPVPVKAPAIVMEDTPETAAADADVVTSTQVPESSLTDESGEQAI